MMEWLSMGGYAVYLWPSFGLFVGFLLWASIDAHRRLQHTLNTISPKPGQKP